MLSALRPQDCTNEASLPPRVGRKGVADRPQNLLNTIVRGDCRQVLAAIQDNSIDLIATDPPYGYGFMGKHWDRALPDPAIWRECRPCVEARRLRLHPSRPRDRMSCPG